MGTGVNTEISTGVCILPILHRTASDTSNSVVVSEISFWAPFQTYMIGRIAKGIICALNLTVESGVIRVVSSRAG